MEKIYDMIIIGGGPAGYTAAIYASRAGLETVVLEKLSAGGQMALTSQIDNYPGFEDGIDGFSLGEKMETAAQKYGAKTFLAEVLSADLTSRIKTVDTSEGIFRGKTVVIATGASPRELDLAGERELTGRGVNYCATCDGMFYKGKEVIVVGGGNTAAQDALLLSRICKKVTVIHRRDTLRATKIYHRPLMAAENVEFIWNSRVSQLIYDTRLKGIVAENVDTGEKSEIYCDGIFVSIGRKPASDIAKGQLEMDQNGYIKADETTITNIEGVYAVGDVRTKPVRQVVTAVADGAAAVHFAEEYLASHT